MNDQELPRMYSLTQIGIATFLGSALAAGYMLASNYTALGRRRLGLQIAWGSLGFVLLYSLIPVDPVTQPGLAIMFMVGQVLLAIAVANVLQGAMLRSFVSMGGQYHPMFRAIAVGIIAAFVLTILVGLSMALFGFPPPPQPNG